MWSDVVGDLITTWRGIREMTRQQLADACAGLGMPELTHAALTNIEGARRKGSTKRRPISIDEIAVISAALNVPPIALLSGYPHHPRISPMPDGKEFRTSKVAQWITSHSSILSEIQGDEALNQYFRAARPFRLLERHRQLVGARLQVDRQLRELRPARGQGMPASFAADFKEMIVHYYREQGKKGPDIADKDISFLYGVFNPDATWSVRAKGELEAARQIDQDIAHVRETMRTSDLPLPPMPREFAYLEELNPEQALAITDGMIFASIQATPDPPDLPTPDSAKENDRK